MFKLHGLPIFLIKVLKNYPIIFSGCNIAKKKKKKKTLNLSIFVYKHKFFTNCA